MSQQPLFFGPLLYFRTVPAFERLSSAHLGAVAHHAEEDFFPEGSPLLHEGQPREAFFVIVQGRVSVRAPDGREEFRGPGEVVGLLHLLARSSQKYEARAIWDTVALRVDWDAYLDVCERHFPVLESHLRYLAGQCQGEMEREGRIGNGASSAVSASPDVTGSSLPDHPLDLVGRLRVLHRNKAFPSTNMDAMGELARHLTEVRLLPGEEIWAPGEVADAFLLVAAGTLRYGKPGEDAQLPAGPGDAVGHLEALAGFPRRGTLSALTPSLGLLIRLEPLMDILEDHFNLALELTAGLAQELIRHRVQKRHLEGLTEPL